MKTKLITVLILSTLILAACGSASTPTQAPTLPPNLSPAQTQSAYIPPAGAAMTIPTVDAGVYPYPVPPTQPPASQAGEASINISGSKFDPATITVKVGTTITWTNQDTTAHTVTADDGSWTSDRLNQGATYSHTFDQAGTYTYKCSIHPSMTGTIVVQP
jgi:plastocyanin